MSSWSAQDVTWESRSLSSLCEDDPILRKLVFPYKVSRTSLFKACESVNGQLPVPFSEQELTESSRGFKEVLEAMDDGQKYLSICDKGGAPSYSLGLYLEQTDAKNAMYVDPYNLRYGNSSTVSVLPLKNHGKKCVNGAGRSISPQDCHIARACGICYLKPYTRIKLKGLCSDEELKEQKKEWFDTDYYIYGVRNGKPHFRGVRNSHIFFDSSVGVWKLQSFRQPHRHAHLSTVGLLPLGTHTWRTVNFCVEEKVGATRKRDLTFSKCYPNKYTCGDGSCKPLR